MKDPKKPAVPPKAEPKKPAAATVAPVTQEKPAAPVAPDKPEPAPKKDKAADPDEPNWVKVRREFGNLPDHRQIQSRFERAAERLGSAEARRMNSWSHKVPGTSPDDPQVDLFAEARDKREQARVLLEEAARLIARVPEDWKPARSVPGSASKPLSIGGMVRIKGRAAKDYPGLASASLKVLSFDDKRVKLDGGPEEGKIAVNRADVTAL